MPQLLYCGSEGEYAMFPNTLDIDPLHIDDKRRGAVLTGIGQQIYRAFAGTTEVWLHARVRLIPEGSTNSAANAFLRVENPAGRVLFQLLAGIGNSSQTFVTPQVATANTGTTFTSFSSLPQEKDFFVNYDIHIKITGTAMLVRLYRNEVLRVSTTVEDAAGWGLPSALLLTTKTGNLQNSDGDHAYWQDVIITDALPTVGMELATLIPSAVGAYNQFSNDYSTINGPGYDPSTVIATDVVGARESWIFADPEFDLGDKVIYGIALTTVAQTDLSAVITDFTPFLRIGQVDYETTNLGANKDTPDAYTTIWTQNPATLQPWQQADLRGLEAGMKTV